MSYEEAKTQSWLKLEEITEEPIQSSIHQNSVYQVRFLADEYTVNLSNHSVLSLSGNVPPPEHIAILVLRYLVKKIEGLPPLEDEWITFRQLTGGEGYYPTFYKRAIEPIKRKYGDNPQGLLTALERFDVCRQIEYGDVAIEILPFENVPVVITLWGKDEEFSSEANILFDQSIEKIFSTEEVVVLTEFIAHSI
ncbi:MAG TPA: hypothetical protein DHV62_07530 [Elusimicrobia bacterium]|jgi:hypothetical protein|nr:hypothetical protein [Elusimicrobiota bacterium]